MRKMISLYLLGTIILPVLLLTGCGPFESGVLDTGVFNTGGTDDPRRLIVLAFNRMYRSDRVTGARNVLRRAIERSEQIGDLYALAVGCNMMGDTYIYKEKDPVIAERYYNKAMKISADNDFYCESVHSYIGFALSDFFKGIPENSCVYKIKARSLIDKIKLKFYDTKGAMLCEGGLFSISDTEKRLLKLNDYLDCEGKDR